MTAMENLGSLWNSIQAWLFPMLEDELGELDEKHREFISVCELCSPQAYVDSYRWVGNGCPPASRLALCKAFIAKAVWDFDTRTSAIWNATYPAWLTTLAPILTNFSRIVRSDQSLI
ncbi:MAG: hypothetical protein JEZ07_16500 [Phycisphaerae bacterium]|nr:hypothetical protein [Phycisphaerae bacterium]